MNKRKVIITAVMIAIIGIFLGANYLMDAWVKQQREGSLAVESGNQAFAASSQVQNLIRLTMDSPEESGVCGENLEWYYKDEVLVITGMGKMDEYIYNAGSAPWYGSLRNQIGCIIIDEGVTSVGGAAFKGCSGMTEVFLPDSVIGIGDAVFEGCDSLREITLPDSIIKIGNGVFRSCDNLKEITLQDGITEIGDEAFEFCSDLREITIPDSVTCIGARSFANCSSLTEIIIPDGVTSIGRGAFCDSGLKKNYHSG